MQNQNWIVIAGKAEVKDTSIKYLPETYKDQSGKDQILHAYVKSNIEFENGEIKFKAIFKDIYARCQVVFNLDNPPIIFAGINVELGLYGIAKFEASKNKIESLSTTGLSETLQLKKEYEIRIVVNGSIINLFVNNVLVSTAYERIAKSQLSFFFTSIEEILIKDIDIQPKQPKAFIVMQFTEEYNQLYQEVIKPVTEEFGLMVERVDDIFTTNPIIQDIVQSLRESSIIIADITPNNPNVFYEVGYSHAINKPTILLCERKRDKLPFDISGFRTLFYDNTIAGKTAVEKNLRKYLEGIFRS